MLSKERRAEQQKNLKTVCRKLLDQYPMYRHRREAATGYQLRVLLLFDETEQEDTLPKNDRLRILLGELMTNGQLLETKLEVMVFCKDAESLGQQLCADAPELCRFVKITGVKTAYELEHECAALTFCSEIPLPGEDCGPWSYVLFCGADAGQGDLLAQQHGNISGEVQASVNGEKIRLIVPEACVLDEKEDEERKSFHEQVAYNVHYGYEKYQDPRASRKEIERSFKKNYNYSSSLANVIHIYSKLACCGIQEQDPVKAAARFAEEMERNPQIVDRLAMLEHYRWALEKLLNGFRLEQDMERIYRYQNADTNGDGSEEDEKWHVALLPCSHHRLRRSDWATEEANCREELDQLDRMSLHVHRKCREIAYERREDIFTDFERLEKKLNQPASQFTEKERRDAVAELHAMEIAVSQMYQKKRIAIQRFDRSAGVLYRSLEGRKDLWAKQVTEALNAIHHNLKPVREYIVDKDYKELNYRMVRQIPFALTHKRNITMAKLFDVGRDDCQFSPWQMEPTDVVYIAFADSAEHLAALDERAGHIDAFLSHSCNEIRRRYHVLLPRKVEIGSWSGKLAELHRVESRKPEDVYSVLTEILKQIQLDYLDLTGGTVVLAGAAEAYARKEKIGSFYVNDSRIYNVYGATELEYPAPCKGISVREMFKQTGADRMDSEGSQISDLSNVYQGFWQVASSTDQWDSFCKFISDQYKSTKSKTDHKLSAGGAKDPIKKKEMLMRSGLLSKLLTVLRELEEKDYIQELAVNWIVGDLMKLEFQAKEKAAQCLYEKLQIIECDDQNEDIYDLKWTDHERLIQVKTLKLTEIELPKENKDEYKRLLRDLQTAKIIHALDVAEGEMVKATFKISALEFLASLRNSGKVLEYYLYYTALQHCQFEDVDMSWKFFHSKDADSAHNEVDVICTKGVSSLFISAKNVKLDTFKYRSNYLNYVCYEVSVLANRFGINARTVLAAPNVPQFEKGKRSERVRHAMSRGVYLLGDACFACEKGTFDSGKLGRVLDNIVRGEEKWCEFLLEAPVGAK